MKDAEEEFNNYRRELYETKSKSEDAFEKYITFISSGALALSLTFIEKITKLENSSYSFLLISGWVLLTLTLFLNLISHYFSKKYTELTIEDLYNNDSTDVLTKKIKKRNSRIDLLTLISIITLFLGISLIVIYISLNAL